MVVYAVCMSDILSVFTLVVYEDLAVSVVSECISLSIRGLSFNICSYIFLLHLIFEFVAVLKILRRVACFIHHVKSILGERKLSMRGDCMFR